MKDIIKKVRKELKDNADPKSKESGQKFFKEKAKILGVKIAVVNNISKANFKNIKDLEKTEILKLCDELWRSGIFEESIVACKWSYFLRKDYKPKDFIIFERWVDKNVNNWASCDTLCNHTIGTFIEKYPKYLANLKEWATSENRWMRRAAAVSLIVPARKGKFLEEILELANLLVLDQDDLVQKGYGWLLKTASKLHQQEIFDYVMQNKSKMPRTALRYAIEKMPRELKAKAMEH